jgi:hypothetical protein
VAQLQTGAVTEASEGNPSGFTALTAAPGNRWTPANNWTGINNCYDSGCYDRTYGFYEGTWNSGSPSSSQQDGYPCQSGYQYYVIEEDIVNSTFKDTVFGIGVLC